MKEIFVTALAFNHLQFASFIIVSSFLVETEELAEIFERYLEVHRKLQIYRAVS